MARKRWRWIALFIVVALGIAAAVVLPGQLAFARIATGYAAQQTCTCLKVSNREMASCVMDFPEDARRLITVTEEGDRVKSSAILGLFHAEATYEEGFGCTPVD